MYRLLDGHPQLFNALEEVYFTDFIHGLPAPVVKEFVWYFRKVDIDELFYNIDERGWFPLGQQGDDYYDMDWDDFKKKINLRRTHVKSLAYLWEMWFSTLQEVTVGGSSLPVVVKNPDYGMTLDNPFLFPRITNRKLKGIVMIRHPFFALSSIRKLRERHKTDDYRAGRTEKHRVFSTARMLSEIGRYYDMQMRLAKGFQPSVIVRFENLLTYPEEVMKDLCKFLEIDFDPVVLEPSFNGQRWIGDSSHTDVLDIISKNPLRPDRVTLTGIEKEIISNSLPIFFKTHGYRSKKEDYFDVGRYHTGSDGQYTLAGEDPD
jgi:hypothetical protein